MKHTTSDSDVTSLATTSPSRSPKGPAYYVQSPSRDSRDDGDKSSSTQATPVYNSPLESPSHQSSLGPHSRASSGSRFSGTLLRSPFGGKHSPGGGGTATRKHHGKGWHEVDVIEEEDDGAYDDDGIDDDDDELFSRGWAAAFWFSVLLLFFAMLCLIVWGAARRYKPIVRVKSLTVDNFYAGVGSDHTGVPTKLVTMNCSFSIQVDNPSTMFGIHVSPASIKLMFTEIPIAAGQLEKFYQPRRSRHAATVILRGDKTPLYGAGATFGLTNDGGEEVPLTLHFAVRSRGYVIGKLVRVTHVDRVRCRVAVSSRSSNPIRFTHHACRYTYT